MEIQPTDTQLVVFRIGRERYALPTSSAREVVNYEKPRQLPGADNWVLGVLNVRGEIIPICDLTHALGLEPINSPERIIICDSAGGGLGIVVDEVLSVMSVSAEDVNETAAIKHPALVGVIQDDDGLIVMLNLSEATHQDLATAPTTISTPTIVRESTDLSGDSAITPPTTAEGKAA